MEENKDITSGVILIGGSAGSLEVLLKLIPGLQPELPYPIVIIIHRGSGTGSPLHELLSAKTDIPIHEIEDKDLLRENCIYITPGDYHLLFEHNRTFSLDDSEKINYSRPSIDVGFESAADIFGQHTTAILLSGANTDGTAGLAAVQRCGGTTIVQAPETAQTPFMPEYAINNLRVDHVLDVPSIVHYLNQLRP